MFAGIYYGGMYGGSTTSILLNTPGRARRSSPRSRATRWPKSRRGAQALATAAIGSFVAGTIGTMLLVLLAPRWLTSRSRSAPRTFRRHGSRLRRGHLRARGVTNARLRLAGPRADHRPGRASTSSTGQQRLTFGIPQLADGIGRRGRRGGSVRRRRGALDRGTPSPRPAEVIPTGPRWTRRTGRDRGSRGCAAPRSAFRSERYPPVGPRCRHSSPT